MNVAFILDPLHSLNPKKDSSLAMINEAQRHGHTCWFIDRASLIWERPEENRPSIFAHAALLTIDYQKAPYYDVKMAQKKALTSFDAILMRQDPPFDNEYLSATWLLERAEKEGARVFNSPRAIRDHSEKIAITEFPQFCPPSLITRSMPALQNFIDIHQTCILKPLDGMGGASIFKVSLNDPNRNVIVETITQFGRKTIMAQQYIKEISQGDKRILLIDGKPIPKSLARIPKSGETRGNLAAGGTGVAQDLTNQDKIIAQAIGPKMKKRGLLLVGLDIIGDYLTEINVTSPTCFVQIQEQTQVNVAHHFLDALEEKIQAPKSCHQTD